MYGYDWVGGHGTPVAWLQAFRLATEHRVRMRYDTASQAPWFEYTDAVGRTHQVWFENAASATAKLDVAKGNSIGGVYVWLYGFEDTNVWAALHQAFPVSTAVPTSTTVRRTT
jgi:spore germination protein